MQTGTAKPDIVERTRRILAGVPEAATPAPGACCSTTKQEVCCEPSEKATCCGTSTSAGTCGCQ